MYPQEYPGHVLFSGEFRKTFISSYKNAGSSAYFDLYQCKTAGRDAPEPLS